MQVKVGKKSVQWVLTLSLSFVFSGLAYAAGPSWQPLNQASQADDSVSMLAERRSQVTHQSLFQANGTEIADYLLMAPHENSGDQTFLLDIPMPYGDVESFILVESPIELLMVGQQPSNNRTYKLTGLHNPLLSGRADVTSKGFRAMIQSETGVVLIDPAPQEGQRVFRSVHPVSSDRSKFSCSAHELESSGLIQNSSHLEVNHFATSAFSPQARSAGNLITYRLAVSATNDYMAGVGGNVEDTISEILTAINRVNMLYERDFGIRLMLVANNGALVERAGENYFSNNNASQLLSENQNWVNGRISANDYDVGHVFATGGGGIARLNSVCNSRTKTEGVSGLSPRFLQDDYFYIGYVAHELGHQFGAYHTFNGTTSSCQGNRTGETAVEPGSGSTVMSYSGICSGENIQEDTDFGFHAISIAQVDNFTNSNGGSCNGLVGNNNSDPVIELMGNLTIPARTPFRLDATVTDNDSSDLLFQWNPMNPGFGSGSTNSSTLGDDRGNNPLFRVYAPQAQSWRDFPALGTQINNQTDKSEVLPTQQRRMNFRLRVDDQEFGQATSDIVVDVAPSNGFRVTSNNGGGTIDTTDGTYRVTWDTADTDLSPINCAEVDVDLLTLSSNNSRYSLHPIATDVANVGCVDINLELAQSHPRGRIQVSCSNNVFYDLSDSDVNIVGASSDSFDDNEYATFFNRGGQGFTLSNGSPGSNSDGNPANCAVYPINGPDLEKPIITLLGFNPLTLSLGDQFVEPGATAIDNVDGEIAVTISLSVINTTFPDTYTITYSATDAAGNKATEIRIVYVIDTVAPVIRLLGGSPLNLFVDDEYIEQGADVSDDFDLSISAVTDNSSVNTMVAGTYTVTYNASDAAGNSATEVTRTVNVMVEEDDEAPKITLLGDNPVSLTVGEDYDEPGATVKDNVDTQISAVIDNSSVNTMAAGTYTVTYNASDASGNSADTITRTVIVAEANATLLPVKADFAPSERIVIDYYTGSGSSRDWIGLYNATQVPQDGKSHNTYLRWVYTNGSSGTSSLSNLPVGNYVAILFSNNGWNFIGEPVAFSVLQGPDVTAPIISLIGGLSISVVENGNFTDPGWSAIDDRDGDVSDQVTVSGKVDTASLGDYTLTYSVEDQAGNASSIVRVVNVTEKSLTLAPVKHVFSSNESIVIDYFTGSGSRRDWIGLYSADEIPKDGQAHSSYQRWVYTNGRSGQASLSRLSAGNYIAILFSNNGWNFIGEPVAFSVAR